jgi:hypothetical protein
MKRILTIGMVILLTAGISGADPLTLDRLSGTYTVDFTRSSGSVGWNRLFVDYSDIAPYTPIHVSATSDAVEIVYSRYAGTITTNRIRVGTGSGHWALDGSNLVQRSTWSGSHVQLPVPGASTRVTEYRLSIQPDGSIVVRNSMVSSGRALWVKKWKNEPVTSILVLSPVTNLVALAETREKWKNHNKAAHGTGSARP